MHLEAHASLGWLLATTYPGSRRFRLMTVLSAIIPDLDALAYLFGFQAYVDYHHVLGHNILFSLIFSGFAVLLVRDARSKVFFYTQIGFWLHFFGDYFFTLYPLYPFWPFSSAGFLSEHAIGLAHPMNTLFLMLGLAAMTIPAFWIKRTPLEFISPSLDQRIVNFFFTSKKEECMICGRKTNEICPKCSRPVCLRHAALTKGFSFHCHDCQKPQRLKQLEYKVCGKAASAEKGLEFVEQFRPDLVIISFSRGNGWDGSG